MARVLFFGKLADIAGMREQRITLRKNVHTIGQLIEQIAMDDAELGTALKETTIRYVVNERMDSGDAISDEDEIAFLPPVSGG